MQLNPGINLLFQKDLNIEAGIRENEEEKIAENELHHDELLNALLENEEFQKAAAQYENEEHHDIHPFLELGLSPEAKPSPQEILTTDLAKLAERAPKMTHTYKVSISLEPPFPLQKLLK